MAKPAIPLFRGQGNDPFRTADPRSAAKRGQTIPYDINGSPTGGVTANPATFNSSGAGAASGVSFDGSSAITVSYNTIGAAPLSHTHIIGDITNLQASLDSKLDDSQAGVFGLTLLGTANAAAAKTALALAKADVGLGNVDNTADAAKNVLSATKMTTARTINGVSFDGTGNIVINAVDATARVPETRTISTTAPLAGGGNLGANLTLSIAAATGAAAGSMSAADKTKLDAVSGTNTGDQFTNMTSSRILGRITGGFGAAEQLTATDARSVMGLGTAALKNTGTSGNNVPLLDGVNTWSDIQQFDGPVQPNETPSAAWAIDCAASSSAGSYVTIANAATYDIAVGSGMVFLWDDAGLGVAQIATFYGQTAIVWQNGALYTTVIGTASKINVYYAGGTGKYRIQNNTGATVNLYVTTLRLRAFS